jgi:hypothetical protein
LPCPITQRAPEPGGRLADDVPLAGLLIVDGDELIVGGSDPDTYHVITWDDDR